MPEGYEIDKEKSTFENIVFKKKDDVIIKWDEYGRGVEIKTEGEHFIVCADTPSHYCSWYDAMRFYCEGVFEMLTTKGQPTWNLPTVKQLQILARHIDKVNEIISANDGFKIHGELWSCEGKDIFYAWYANMNNGITDYSLKNNYNFVRAVSTL